MIDKLKQINASRKEVFALRVDDCHVWMLPKPNMFGNRDFTLADHPLAMRAQRYKQFIEEVLEIYPIPGSWYVGIDVCDGPVHDQPCPMLVFQKPHGARSVLFPDIDLILSGYFKDIKDDVAYQDKASAGIFSGATTGGGLINIEKVKRVAFERLRSALFFKGVDNVVFALPKIVQCENDEVVQALRELELGSEIIEWAEQFKRKFLLSLDGNGAACSRVAIALKSNSVLVKYQSSYELYYFSGLCPWKHFIPVTDDQSIVDLVLAEVRQPGLFNQVASEGCAFFHNYLNEEAVKLYASQVLSQMASIYQKAR